MAGVKGRSGGARANSGGARPGAGRKPKAKPQEVATGTQTGIEAAPPPAIPECDMLTLLKDIALGRVKASNIQVRAAIAAVQYTHTKRADGGKKDEAAVKAEEAAKGKYGTRTGPRLVASK